MTTPELHPRQRVERISGSDLHCWVYPDRPGAAEPETVLMVHGLRGTHDGLELIAAELTDQRVAIPDLPGFGDSGPMTGNGHDIAGYAEAMLELVRRLGGDERPISLVGHSFGSIVAARLAASAPELVRRLVLINAIASPALGGPRVVLSSLTAAYYSLGAHLPVRAAHSLLSNRWVVLAASRAMTRTRDPLLRGFIDRNHLRNFSRFHSPALLGETFRASVTHTVADYADALTMPVLLIAGESDDIAPVGLDSGVREEVRALLAQNGLPLGFTGPETGELLEHMSRDKKRRGARRNLVLLRAPGDVAIECEVPDELLRQAIEELSE